jgi:hypothetical protein
VDEDEDDAPDELDELDDVDELEVEDEDEELEEPEVDELPELDDEVGAFGVLAPQLTRKAPAAIDAAPDRSSRNCRRSGTSIFASGTRFLSATVWNLQV